MSKMIKAICLAVSISTIFTGCVGGGSSAPTVELPADATPFTTGEMYTYFAEQTQVRDNGAIYYTELGTLISLEDGERFEGTWGSYDGGKLCHHFEDREDPPCETYYHNSGGVIIAMAGKTTQAPQLSEGNQLDLIETGSVRKLYSTQETTALVSGNTHDWGDGNGAYYDPSGKLVTLWESVKESGKWTVNNKGGLCWHIPSWGSQPCEQYFMGPEGLMSIYKGKEDTADAILEGDQLNNL